MGILLKCVDDRIFYTDSERIDFLIAELFHDDLAQLLVLQRKFMEDLFAPRALPPVDQNFINDFCSQIGASSINPNDGAIFANALQSMSREGCTPPYMHFDWTPDELLEYLYSVGFEHASRLIYDWLRGAHRTLDDGLPRLPSLRFKYKDDKKTEN